MMAGTDDVFKKVGPWHYSVMAFCFLRGFPAAYHAMAPTFTAPNLKHWCARPSQLANWSTQQWLEEGVPWEERKGFLQPSQCEMYAYEEAPGGSLKIFNDSRMKCFTWEYDLSDQTYTLTNTFHLVCDRVWLRAASQSVYMTGIMIGNTVFSHLSDWYGRRQSLVFMMPLPIIAGLLTTFASSFWLYNIGRLIASIGIGGIQNTTFTIAMEVLSTRHRALGMLVASGGWTTGLVTLTGIAWLIRDWQHLQVVISLVYLGNFFIWLFMPESPLWLLASKRYKKAEIILKQATTRNKVADVDINEIIKSYKVKMEWNFFDAALLQPHVYQHPVGHQSVPELLRDGLHGVSPEIHSHTIHQLHEASNCLRLPLCLRCLVLAHRHLCAIRHRVAAALVYAHDEALQLLCQFRELRSDI
ncbi:solute carrier family 22 member 13-like [Dermacentor albipictus]|uniref:solute carrier family 22 member 13-like n=1 Tax=Dermacentor albipictus TaxID=60249 RepID=UPI0038FC8B1C